MRWLFGIVAAILLLPTFVHAQEWTMADLFPVQSRRTWHYSILRQEYNRMADSSRSDSGNVTLSIMEYGSTDSNVTWKVEERRDVISHGRHQDSTFFIHDTGTVSYTLDESLKGYHALEVNYSERHQAYAWFFHYDPMGSDTGHVFRFGWVKSGHDWMTQYEDSFDPFGQHAHTSILRAGVGVMMDSVYYSGEWSSFTYASHLTDSTVLGVRAQTDDSRRTDRVTLLQNYPNPFNPSTSIRFDLPDPATVTMKVYDALGLEVSTLLDHQAFEAGQFQIQFIANDLASGLYFTRIDAYSQQFPSDHYTEILKMLFVK